MRSRYWKNERGHYFVTDMRSGESEGPFSFRKDAKEAFSAWKQARIRPQIMVSLTGGFS